MKAKSRPEIRRKTGQFQKGQSGNPGGRPKGTAGFGEEIRTFLGELEWPKKTTRLQGLIKRLYVDDPKTLLAYGFGKPIEPHEISGSLDVVDLRLVNAARELMKAK